MNYYNINNVNLLVCNSAPPTWICARAYIKDKLGTKFLAQNNLLTFWDITVTSRKNIINFLLASFGPTMWQKLRCDTV